MTTDREFIKCAKHLPGCRVGSRVDCDPQATFGAPCSCGLDEILDRIHAARHSKP